MSKDLLYFLIWQLAAGLIIFLWRGEVKKPAFVLSVISFLFSFHTFFEFIPKAGTQFLIDYWWIQDLGISFKMGMDGISFLLVQLTNILVPLIIFSSFHHDIKNPRAFYGLILFMQFALVGVFTALDGFLFYVFWELALIPIYFICLLWGGERRVSITLKFFIYTLTGSLLMLVAFIYLYLQTPGNHSFDIYSLYNLPLSEKEQDFIFWAFFIGFAIKIPVFPLHTWQPDTYVVAPTPGTMLLSGIMLKMGLYGLIRWLLPVVPQACMKWADVALILSITGIVYASCIALAQHDFKRLIAYSSIAHVGLIAAGIFSFTVQGMQGAMIQMLSHGMNVIGLFLVADIIMNRFNTRDMISLGGIANHSRVFSILFMIVLLGSIALPLTNGFIGEFMLLTGIFIYNKWFAAAAALSVILGAVYMLRSYKKMMLGEVNPLTSSPVVLSANEKWVLIIIAGLIIGIGIYPKPLLAFSEPSVEIILQNFK